MLTLRKRYVFAGMYINIYIMLLCVCFSEFPAARRCHSCVQLQHGKNTAPTILNNRKLLIMTFNPMNNCNFCLNFFLVLRLCTLTGLIKLRICVPSAVVVNLSARQTPLQLRKQFLNISMFQSWLCDLLVCYTTFAMAYQLLKKTV